MPTNVYSHIDFACRQGRKRDNISRVRTFGIDRRTERGFKPSSATARPSATMSDIARFARLIGVMN